MFFVVVIFLLCEPFLISANQGEVIQTQSGLIRGKIQSSSLAEVKVQKFLNIPYAEPPVGELRFQKPQPKKPWNGTLNTTEDIIACIQPERPGLTLTEDCLILNVWTPFPRPKNASVMVWIHGGAFRFGSSGEYPGTNFVAVGGVILVTINYRLTALGFLATGDDRIKGNLGLYDQRLALKWVKDNIEYFGGNSNSITLFGESAGGASVSAHTVSKGSWEYFDKAIFQSGNMLMPWAIMTDTQTKGGLRWFLEKVKCSDDDNLIECLRNVSVDTWKRISNRKDFWTVWTGPIVDKEFITDQPKKIWESGNVKKQDVILSFTKDEAFLNDQELLKTSKNISDYLNWFEHKLKAHFKNASEAVYEKARELYQPKCIPSFLEALKPSVAFGTDESFICASRHEAKLRSKIMNTTHVYVFQYSHAPLVKYVTYLYPYGVFGFSAHGLDIVVSMHYT
ncbi:cholinesterase-like [Dendronephthya gigantea]|uniref:cholinesterase-like n=1 Tax=Dendronephthya gigantea TaxID=151771 RepID=UPI00106D53DD|nr:cholinesterase-like [Dendronephthya gigantea]